MKTWVLMYDLDEHKFVTGSDGAISRNRVKPSITNKDREHFKRVAKFKGIKDYKLYAIEDRLFRQMGNKTDKEALRMFGGW